MEDVLAQALTTDTAIAAYFDTDRHGNARDVEAWFFGPSSLGEGDSPAVPDRPYMMWNEGNDVPFRDVEKATNATVRNFRIYVYDYKGDFTRINAILKEVRRVVKAMAPFVTLEGEKCHESKWAGMSGNLVDDGLDSCVRYGFAEFAVSS